MSVDELHYFKGSLGAHTSLVMKRLTRIIQSYSSNQLLFIACSATLDQPRQHAKHFFGIDMVCIDQDG